jgi:hypothetical protein
MATQDSVSNKAKALGSVLIVLVGLLNFHLPHFVLERAPTAGDTVDGLELVFLANMLAAAVAAVAIWRNHRWGWVLGVAVVALSFALYLAQETAGLPGLPKNWWEPSRLVALVIEALFIVVARPQLISRQRTPGRA